jgi:hypothetical protein
MFPEDIKRDFLHVKVNYLFFLKNHIKGYCRTMFNAWCEMMLDHRMMHQIWTTTSLQATSTWGNDDPQTREKMKFMKFLEDEVSSDRFGYYSLL